MSAVDDDAEVVNEYGKFTMIPLEIVLADPKELSANAKVLYMHFVQMANDGMTVRSRKQLGERLGRGVDTVDRVLKELSEFGALRITRRFKEDGSPDWSEYRLIIIRRPKRGSTQGVAANMRPPRSTEGVAANMRPPSRNGAARGGRKNAVIEEDLAESKNPPSPPEGGVDDPAAPHEDQSLFEQFWQAYPKQVDYDHAREIWFSRHRSIEGASPSAIIAAAQAFAEHHRRLGTDPQYIPKPGNWLRSGSYKNPLPEPPKSPYRKLN